MRRFEGSDPDHRSIARWLSAWEERIEGLDPGAARELFEPGTVSFGTLADVAVGLDEGRGEGLAVGIRRPVLWLRYAGRRRPARGESGGRSG